MDYIEAPAADEVPAYAQRHINLADARLGAEIVEVSDQFFAPAERMISHTAARFYPGRYDDHGKWMDGWESRRKRVAGQDYCIVKLAVKGVIAGVDIDTSFFTGNYPPAAILEACSLSEAECPSEQTEWTTLLPASSLNGNSHHYFEINDENCWSHLRITMLPDGGIARLRVYGTPKPKPAQAGEKINLAALERGARIVAVNNAHFGDPSNMLAPSQGENMGDGWETRRRREPGNDWCVIELGQPGVIDSVEVDTAFFKGNFPDRCSMQAAYMSGATDQSLVTQSMFWQEILPPQPLSADSLHHFKSELSALGVVSHVRFNIHPDGGVSRLRIYGSAEQ